MYLSLFCDRYCCLFEKYSSCWTIVSQVLLLSTDTSLPNCVRLVLCCTNLSLYIESLHNSSVWCIGSAVELCLFVSGRTVVYRSHYKRPQFPPKVDFGVPSYRLKRLLLRLMLTGPAGLCWRLNWPGRTPSCCVAWQLQHCVFVFI